MAANRSAGYCPNCNRGVSIVKPQPTGLMNKMRSALQQADEDSGWVCTKCGLPATRGYVPPATAITPSNDTEPAPETPQPDTDPESLKESGIEAEPVAETPPAARLCPFCAQPNPARAENCSSCNKDMNLPSKFEATCHLCNKLIDFDADSAGEQISCPGCNEAVVLPDLADDSSALTRAPGIMKLDDDLARPDVSKALCTECNFELTYPKRLAGKNVDCPSCSIKFILP